MDDEADKELVADLTKAMRLFLKGAALEEEGELRDAVNFYRKAVQLVPDVEQKVHELSQKTGGPAVKKEKADEGKGKDDSEVEFEDLSLKFSQIIYQQGTVCLPQSEQQGTHISRLPPEVVLLLLRWVVSSELDFRSWARFAAVCRGFYLVAQDNELWRLICRRAWGCPVEGRSKKWRLEFDRRPRVRVDGCYIARITYVRPGELSFQTSTYLPWHSVQYFRFLRFFTGGRVLMLTTSEQPKVGVGYLRYRWPVHPQVLSGRFKIDGTTVRAELFETAKPKIRPEIKRRVPPPPDSGRRKYILELQICVQKLIWSRYCIETTHHTGQKSVCDMDMSGSQYPAMSFARVRSYTQVPTLDIL